MEAGDRGCTLPGRSRRYRQSREQSGTTAGACSRGTGTPYSAVGSLAPGYASAVLPAKTRSRNIAQASQAIGRAISKYVMYCPYRPSGP